jgi:hypothetical protein
MKARLRDLKVGDISSTRTSSASNLPRPSSVAKTKPGRNVSTRELRRLTGNKKGR